MMGSRGRNQKVTIQRKGPDKDEIGQPLQESWIDLATNVWSEIRHLSGIAQLKGDAPASIVRASIRIGYRTDVAAGMRVIHGATVYSVLAPLPDLVKKQHVDLVCEVLS